MDLNQVTLPSINLKESVEFYKKLGLQVIVNALPRYVRFELPQGNATLSVHLVEELPKGTSPVIYFEEELLDNKVKELQSNGIEFDLLPTDQTWLWREAKLKDPSGNQLILYFAGINRKNPPWRVNS